MVDGEGKTSHRRALTDREIAALWPGATTWAALFEFARRIERAHGIEEHPGKGETLPRMQANVCEPLDVFPAQKPGGQMPG